MSDQGTLHEQLARMILAGITSGDDNTSRIARNIAHDLLRNFSIMPAPRAAERETLDLYRQWFDAVQDVNPAYLERKDYVLAKALYEQLGMRVDHSILRGIETAPSGEPSA